MNNRLSHSALHFLLPLLAATLLFSCSNERRLAKGKPLKSHTPGYLVKNNEKEDFKFEWLGMKVGVDMKSEGVSESFKATIRIRKDSLIWISLSPALGVEMVRMVITPDSVKYISKVPNNKHYYLGDFSVIGDVAHAPLDFQMIQNILVGNPIMMDKGDDKFVSLIDKQQYVLISKFDRRLKKVLDYDEKDMLPNSVVKVNPLSKEYQRAIRRSTLDELMIKRFWLNGHHLKMERTLLNDLMNLRDIELDYSDFKTLDGQLYPTEGRLKVTAGNDWQEVKFEISRIRISKTYDFPFEIPEDYERRY